MEPSVLARGLVIHWQGRRFRCGKAGSLAPHFVEVEHIEEMHAAEDDQDQTELGAEKLE
jgi:hypothetical protein